MYLFFCLFSTWCCPAEHGGLAVTGQRLLELDTGERVPVIFGKGHLPMTGKYFVLDAMGENVLLSLKENPWRVAMQIKSFMGFFFFILGKKNFREDPPNVQIRGGKLSVA